MSISQRRIGIRYGLAVVSVAVVALLRWLLQPALAEAAPLILFVLPIVLAGWYGGIALDERIERDLQILLVVAEFDGLLHQLGADSATAHVLADA